MKTVITHIIAYGLTYLLLATSFLGALAVINRLLFHKALLNQWKSRLFWFTFSLIAGCILTWFRATSKSPSLLFPA